MVVDELVKDGIARELKVVIAADDLHKKLAGKLEELRSKARIKGFRPGKVPLAHLKKLYARNLMAEILNEELEAASKSVLKDRSEKPIFVPDIEVAEDEGLLDGVLSGNRDFVFNMKFDVFPEFDSKDLSEMKLEKLVTEVSDDQIEEFLSKMAAEQVEYTAVKSPQRKVKKDDRVDISFTGTMDGEPIEGGSLDNYKIVIGSNQLVDTFEEQLIGQKKGDDPFEVKVTFPQDYGSEKLAGKEGVFMVIVNAIEQPSVPEVNDEFAKKFGLESLGQLKEEVKKQLNHKNQERSYLHLKRQIFNKFDEWYDFELPMAGVENELKQLKEQYLKQGKAEDAGDKEEELSEEDEKDLQRVAARRVRSGLVLRKLADEHDLNVSQEELSAAVVREIRRFPNQEKEIRRYYAENPRAVHALSLPILEDKVSRYIMGVAKVEEKSVATDEFGKLVDEV